MEVLYTLVRYYATMIICKIPAFFGFMTPMLLFLDSFAEIRGFSSGLPAALAAGFLYFPAGMC